MVVWGVRALVSLTFAGCLTAWSAGAWAAAGDIPDPVYNNLRYTDDFSHPAPNKKPDPWDKLKFIPIGDGALGPTFLTLGGEWRERFESYVNPNLGIPTRRPPPRITAIFFNDCSLTPTCTSPTIFACSHNSAIIDVSASGACRRPPISTPSTSCRRSSTSSRRRPSATRRRSASAVKSSCSATSV